MSTHPPSLPRWATAVTLLAVAACYTEGYSHSESEGARQWFFAFAECRNEGISLQADGETPKYSYYTCEKRVLGFLLNAHEFQPDGQSVDYGVFSLYADQRPETRDQSGTRDERPEGRRVHIATFDTPHDSAMRALNQRACEGALDLYQKRDGAKVRYWCEEGRNTGVP